MTKVLMVNLYDLIEQFESDEETYGHAAYLEDLVLSRWNIDLNKIIGDNKDE